MVKSRFLFEKKKWTINQTRSQAVLWIRGMRKIQCQWDPSSITTFLTVPQPQKKTTTANLVASPAHSHDVAFFLFEGKCRKKYANSEKRRNKRKEREEKNKAGYIATRLVTCRVKRHQTIHSKRHLGSKSDKLRLVFDQETRTATQWWSNYGKKKQTTCLWVIRIQAMRRT